MRIDHPSEFAEAEKGHRKNLSSCEASSSLAVPLLWKLNTLRVQGWLSLIMVSLLAIQICEQERFYRHVQHARTNVDTLMKHVGLFVKNAEQMKSAMISDRFASMLDVWCNARLHYMTSYLPYPASTDCIFACVRLSRLSRMRNVSELWHTST